LIFLRYKKSPQLRVFKHPVPSLLILPENLVTLQFMMF
jgi:hypothetical protein